MPHPRFRGANAAYRTVHATFQALEAPFRTSSAGLGSPGSCFRTSLARFSAVEGRIGLVKPARKVVGRGTRRRVAQHAVRKPASQVGTGSIWFRQNSGQSPDGAEGSRKALWFSEGIRPLPMRRNPKRRFRPTRALGLVLRRGRHPLRRREVGQKRLGGAPPPPATPSCAVAGRCTYNLWISDINTRARMVRGRAPDTDTRPIPET
jgi:hypothetical protein